MPVALETLARRWAAAKDEVTRLKRVPVTVRSRPAGALLRTVESFGVASVVHELRAPRGACPVSGNPLSGTVRISYAPVGCVLEVVALLDALAWAASGADGAPRSVEAMAHRLAAECGAAVGVPVVVVLDLVIRPGRQRLVVTASS